MKLLIVTQTVDSQDPALGFFVEWVRAFSRTVESVQVICLKEGTYDLPENVHVHSLGKEEGRQNRFVYSLRFLRYVWDLRNEYDSVFVHMNVEYLIIAGPLWRLLKKRIGLWYVHSMVSTRLRLGLLWTHLVFTASRESFRLPIHNLHIMGHGIEARNFERVVRHQGSDIRLVTTGRIAAAKRIDRMIEVVAELEKLGTTTDFEIIGAPATTQDTHYLESLKEKLVTNNLHTIRLTGPIPHNRLPEALENKSVFINLSTTGSMDKAVLEALAAGLPVVTTNTAFADCAVVDFSQADSVKQLALRVVAASHRSQEPLRAYAQGHSLENLIRSIISEYSAFKNAK